MRTHNSRPAAAISAVVLAAGRGERMGAPKLLLPLGGKPVVQWVLETALSIHPREVICVARELQSVRQHVALDDERLWWLVNYAADRGQSTSVIAGLWAIDPRSEGALFLVGDQPLIRADLLEALIERFWKTGASIVAPTFKGEARNPVLFRRDLFPELLRLTGDRGGRFVIEKNKRKAEFVEWDDEIPFMDLDVREDYERLKQLA
ncbi:MAG TPA: nucleotidyltransferase family protein [Candidatus Eisenbacteria bacterium]|nr:nucleotidyltransferase family protein [Candidatus Eisenbacteria bacterium]